MGARINFLFKTNMDTPYIALYSHWGWTTWQEDLAKAIDKARPRWNDDSYALRIIIDQLTKDSRDSETGYGIFLCPSNEIGLLDYPVVIDMQAQYVNDTGTEHSWDSFCEYHLEEIPSNHDFSKI